MKFFIFSFSSFLLFLSTSFATTKTLLSGWIVSEGSTIEIKAKYTFGTHKLSTSEIKGSVKEDNGTFSGQVSVPIKSIKEGRKELECHLQESLGLNYENSGFPKKHVCDDNDELPETGPNKIEYANIQFDISSVIKNKDKLSLTGKWTMHGVSKEEKIEFQVNEENSSSLKAQADVKFSLKDFGVIVKKAFVISVNDTIDVKLNLVFKKKEI